MSRGAKHPSKGSGRLFSDHPEPPGPLREGAYLANIDGAARGNPGPASYGVLVRRPDGTTHESLGKYIGRATNNVAEYYALIAALDYAAAQGIKNLRVRSDSQLIVNQMKGLYKVKHPDLRPLHERAKKQAAGLAAFHIEYVPREQNGDADALANAALDATSSAPKALNSSPRKTSDTQAGPQRSSPSEANVSPPRSPIGSRKIRARFRDGLLIPAEPLGYGEDEELEITIERPARRQS